MKKRFFELAKRLSFKSNHPQHKLGCVITRKNKVISFGFNEIKTHTKSNHKYKMLHAEISALIGLPFEELQGCTAYVYRQKKDGSTAIARPCEACRLALSLAGISTVCYTDEEGFKEEVL